MSNSTHSSFLVAFSICHFLIETAPLSALAKNSVVGASLVQVKLIKGRYAGPHSPWILQEGSSR